jgi:quercetin dioxygenase-like cupin family protein
VRREGCGRLEKITGKASLAEVAGRYEHEGALAPHTHSFVEVVVVPGSDGVHHAPGGRRRLTVGDVVLLRPGGWHGYEDCRGHPGALRHASARSHRADLLGRRPGR